MNRSKPGFTPEAETGVIAPRTARKIARRWPLVSAAAALMLVAALGLIIGFRRTQPFEFDIVWMHEIVEHRSPLWTAPALVMDLLGGGIIGAAVIPALTFLAFLVFRRPNAALYYAIAAILSAGLVQLTKFTVDRARPTDILVQSDVGSFPSGHTANAATIVVVLAIVFPRVWIWVAGAAYTVIMMLSRTYLGAHWLSDTLGGLLLGAGVAIIVWAPFAYKLLEERARPHRPIWYPR